MNSTLKIVHVLCACLFLGNVVVSGIWAALAERTRNQAIIQFSNRLVLITDLHARLFERDHLAQTQPTHRQG